MNTLYTHTPETVSGESNSRSESIYQYSVMEFDIVSIEMERFCLSVSQFVSQLCECVCVKCLFLLICALCSLMGTINFVSCLSIIFVNDLIRFFFFLWSFVCVCVWVSVSLGVQYSFVWSGILVWFWMEWCELTMSHLNWWIWNGDFLRDWPTMTVLLQPIFECYRRKIAFFATTKILLMPGLLYNT